jgi:hypothetical protein
MRHNTKKKQTIYELLGRIQTRPGMYLSSRTLSSLHDFLNGYSVGLNSVYDERENEPSFGDFSAWFCYHHRNLRAGSGGWYGAIMDELLNDKQAFDRFFEYIATYHQRTPEYQRHLTLTSAQRKHYSMSQGSVAPERLRLTRYKGERCVFLHALSRQPRAWYLHTVFESTAEPRRWFKYVFRITDAQWMKAMSDAA